MNRVNIQEKLATALDQLPSQEEIRRRLADNLKEREALRKLIRIVNLREQAGINLGSTDDRSGGAA